MILRIGGVPLHVLCEGEGPACVLSGGLGCGWFDWDPVVAMLTPYRTVVRFDRPGYGFSAPACTPPTAAGEAERILGVLDALRLEGPVTVVGHSIAGFHVEAFARLFPHRTAGVVLVDSSVEEDPRPARGPAVRASAAEALATALSAAGLPRAIGPAARRLTVRAITASRRDLAPSDLVRRCYSTGRPLRAALLENALYKDVAAELMALREHAPLPAVPVTVLAADDGSGSRRQLRWLARQRRLAAALEGAEFRTAAPARHLLMADRPEAVAQAVLGHPAV